MKARGSGHVAIQRDQACVQMPFMVSTLPALRLLPVWAFDQLTDFFRLNNAMDAFTGRIPGGRRLRSGARA